MRNMPYAPTMVPMLIPDPALVKRKMSLTKDAGNDHRRYLQFMDHFGLRATGHCEIQKDRKSS